MAVEIQAESSEASLLICQDNVGATKSRVSANGTFVTSVQSAPSDEDLEVGECAWWYDLENDLVRFKTRKNSTDYYDGQLKLSIIP
jgi:hypothetical protein